MAACIFLITCYTTSEQRNKHFPVMMKRSSLSGMAASR